MSKTKEFWHNEIERMAREANNEPSNPYEGEVCLLIEIPEKPGVAIVTKSDYIATQSINKIITQGWYEELLKLMNEIK